MKKTILFLFLVLTHLQLTAQVDSTYEKPPVFPECESESIEDLKGCFYDQLSQRIYENFKVPGIVNDENYKGDVVVLFEVDKEGNFIVIYIDAVYDELKTAARLVFAELPKIRPANYNGNPTFKQYSYRIAIPLVEPGMEAAAPVELDAGTLNELEKLAKNEIDSINKGRIPYDNAEYRSQLNVPFTHHAYSRFDRSLNLVGSNMHTASKPYVYEQVSKYHDFASINEALDKSGESWFKRKLFNEHLVEQQGKDYWFTVDPVFDLQLGKDSDADFGTTFNNTRGIFIQGGLGKKFSFSASIFESQGRFGEYFNQYAESLKAFGPDPAIVPGRGIGKGFKDGAYDYPVAEGYISFTPAKFLNVQFGHGKNFIGDGYRSLLVSDVASPSPFLKLNAKFWKIQYTSTWMWLKDVRPEVTEDGAFLSKYMANHYLSWNVSKRLNIGLFESVLWTNTNDRGFDVNYLNPVIFFRAVEFETGQDAGNALVGATAKYKLNDQINLYSQFILDEFSINDIKAGDKSWKNKFGYQVGVKYYDAFKIPNLYVQLEYNRVRPYTYSHNSIVLNYGHNNQSMAHLWGANFSEAILIGRYHLNRWYADAKFIVGKRGLDFKPNIDMTAYGGDIFTSENQRPGDSGIEVAQGNLANVFHTELQAGYLVNPATNLKLFAFMGFREFDLDLNSFIWEGDSSFWFSIGLRTDLFNWYVDF